MKCQKCGFENNENAKFCSSCGAKLVKPKKVEEKPTKVEKVKEETKIESVGRIVSCAAALFAVVFTWLALIVPNFVNGANFPAIFNIRAMNINLIEIFEDLDILEGVTTFFTSMTALLSYGTVLGFSIPVIIMSITGLSKKKLNPKLFEIVGGLFSFPLMHCFVVCATVVVPANDPYLIFSNPAVALLFTASLVMLLAVIFNLVVDYISKRASLGYIISTGITLLSILLCAFMSFGELIKYADEFLLSPFVLMGDGFMDEALAGPVFAYSILVPLFIYILVAMIYGKLYPRVRCTLMVLPSIVATFRFVGYIQCQSILTIEGTFTESIAMAPQTISLIVFTILILASSIVALTFDKKDKDAGLRVEIDPRNRRF